MEQGGTAPGRTRGGRKPGRSLGLSPYRRNRVLNLIQQHHGRPLSVGDLAAAVNMSPFHFTRMFRDTTGFTPHQFITRVRLNEARYLLRTTNHPVAEVARMVGFRRDSDLCASFRAAFAMTPSQFRRGKAIRL